MENLDYNTWAGQVEQLRLMHEFVMSVAADTGNAMPVAMATAIREFMNEWGQQCPRELDVTLAQYNSRKFGRA